MAMNPKTKVLFGILIVGLIAISGLWILTQKDEGSNEKHVEEIIFEGDCDKLEEQIHILMESANYCKVDSDCVILTEFGCPFGCYNLFNKNADLTGVRKGIEKYYENCDQCLYDCDIPPSQEEVICKDNRCMDSRYIEARYGE